MSEPELSIIIPAYNEATLIGQTITTARRSAETAGRSFEIIVVNDASSDETAMIAGQAGARVIDVELRHIAAVRNRGAEAARGDVLIFIDADTLVPERTFAAALHALESGAVGGGATVEFRGRVSRTAKMLTAAFQVPMRWVGVCAGCFAFARRDAFAAAGGYDERFYASEETWFARALRRQGRFVVLRERVHSSGRKFRMYGTARLLWTVVRLAVPGLGLNLKRREGLSVWYDPKREGPGLDDA